MYDRSRALAPSSPPPLSPLRAATTPTPGPEEPPFAALVLTDLFQLLERALDTVEDIGVHLRRATERDMDRRFRKDRLSTKGEKPRVMVLGTGGWVDGWVRVES